MSTKTAAVPQAGKTVSVRVDARLAEDLEILSKSGLNTSEAVKYCVNAIALAYYKAWNTGQTPEGQVPEGLAIVMQPDAS